MTSRIVEMIVPLYVILVRPQLESCICLFVLETLLLVCFRNITTRKDIELLKHMQKIVMKLVKKLKSMTYKKQLRKLGLLSLENRKLNCIPTV